MFPEFNEGLAYIIANKMLLRYGAGYLKYTEKCDEFKRCIERFKRSNNAVELCKFLMHDCWNKIMV